MAAGMFTKQADFLTARFLNDVNDSVVGGQIQSVPAAVPATQGIQTLPGDRIILDDATALALSDTAVGTLWGGIYEYVVSKAASTAAPAVGSPAFFLAADIGSTSGPSVQYEVTPDAQPTAAIATFFQGVYINAVTKGNACWIQLCGIANCLFQATVTAGVAGNPVTVGISQTPPAFDSGVAAFSTILAAGFVGVAVQVPTNAGVKQVALTRFPGRL